MKPAVAFVACLAMLSMAHAQCPITAQEASSVDFSGVASACAGVSSSPSFDVCDACTTALAQPLGPYLARFGVSCDNIPSTPAGVQSTLTQSLTPCFSVLQRPLQGAQVNVLGLINLRNCPTDKFGPKLTGAIQQLCPNWKPDVSSTSGR